MTDRLPTPPPPDLVGRPRRKVLFIRHKARHRAADFLNVIEDGWQRTLALHSDVTMIDHDFDYGAVCDRVNPDFVLLEDPGGYRPNPVRITNAGARPDIPKVALQIQDPHDTARVAFLKLLDEMKIERFFTLGTATFRQSPELRGRAFTLGQYFDPDLYRDHGEEKLLPVSVFGGLLLPEFYKWRSLMAPEIAKVIPTMIYAHPGYNRNIPRHKFAVQGEAYARMLSRSHFSLADATREGYLVRKHLEIPACGAILVSPDEPEVRAYGFRDLENCVLGVGKELIDKIAHVADNPDLYARIRRAGHAHVHGRYTRYHWTWIADWFEAHKALQPGETVQQHGFLGPFVAVKSVGRLPAATGVDFADSDFHAVMRRARRIIVDGGNLAEAEALLSQVARWCGHVGEPWVPLGILSLLAGKPGEAIDRLRFPEHMRERREGVSFDDPEELAWLWLAARIDGREELLAEIDRRREGLRHVSLRRMAAVHRLLDGSISGLDFTDPKLEMRPGDRLSIHWTSQIPLETFADLAGRIMAVYRPRAGLALGAA